MSAVTLRRPRAPLELLLVFAAFAAVLLPSAAGALSWNRETIAGTLAPHPSLTLDATGIPYVAFNLGAQPSFASRASGSWVVDPLSTPAAKQPAELDLIYFVEPSLALTGPAPSPFLIYYKAPETDIWFARRSAGIWSYERLSTTGYRPSVKTDHDGVPHIVFDDAALGPRYGVLGPGGWTFEPAPGIGSLAVDFLGRPQMVMVQGGALKWALRSETGWVTETADPAGGYLYSIATDGAGEPHLAYSNNTTQQIRYAHRVGGTWTSELVASNVGQSVSTSIALGAGGEPFIAYYNATAGDFCFARRVGGVWTSEVVEHAFSGNDFCSLAIDAAGRPHVAYYSAGAPQSLRYATTSTPVTGVEPASAGLGFAIASAAPNPVRAGRAIDLALRLDGPREITLELLDLAGRRVATRETAALGAGLQHLTWSPRVASGGLYFIAVRTDRGESRTTRIALLP